MTIVRKNTLNSSNFTNFGEPKKNVYYDDTPKENVAKELGVSTSELERQHAVTFDKQPQNLPTEGLNLPTDEEVVEEVQSDHSLSPAEERTQRRVAFKRAADVERRAMQMQKEAQATLQQTKQVKQFMDMFDKDPIEAVKILGRDPEAAFAKFQNAMLHIPNDPPKPTAEQEYRQRLDRLEEERKREKEEAAKRNWEFNKQDYVSNHIVPVITGDPDRFEILNGNDPKLIGAFIYDMMNTHFLNTGEELDIIAVCEETESRLLEEMEKATLNSKKFKKLAKHYRTDTDAPGEELTVNGSLADSSIEKRQSAQTNQSQLGAPLSQDTSVNTKSSQGPSSRRPIIQNAPPPTQVLGQAAAENSYQRLASWDRKREQRINKIEEYAKKSNITRNT